MKNTIDSETGLPLLDTTLGDNILAAHQAGTLRKELTTVQASVPHNGYTIADNLVDTSVGLNNVNLIKIGVLGG